MVTTLKQKENKKYSNVLRLGLRVHHDLHTRSFIQNLTIILQQLNSLAQIVLAVLPPKQKTLNTLPNDYTRQTYP